MHVLEVYVTVNSVIHMHCPVFYSGIRLETLQQFVDALNGGFFSICTFDCVHDYSLGV